MKIKIDTRKKRIKIKLGVEDDTLDMLNAINSLAKTLGKFLRENNTSAKDLLEVQEHMHNIAKNMYGKGVEFVEECKVFAD